MKKALLMIVDALASRVVEQAMSAGRLPHMQALAEAGSMRAQCTSIFPSLTLAATPSITTGMYPARHGMMGAYWYEEAENRVVYFGADSSLVFLQGPGKFLTDFLVRLNDRWLDVPTIFERVDAADHTTASINWFVYKGPREHKINMPVLHLVPNAPAAQTIWGPSTLHLGDFTTHSDDIKDGEIGAEGGVFDRLGFTDHITHELLVQLVENGAFPDFTLAYFPDNDFNSHEVGPEAAVTTLEQFDAYLGELFAAYGGMDKMLADIAIVITGDHSQSAVVDDPDAAAIDLTQVLPDFPAAEVGKGFEAGTDVVLCPNGRVASIYLRDVKREKVNRIIQRLIDDERVDQVMCSEGYLNTAERGYHVFTSDRGELNFGLSAQDGDNTLQDRYGTRWYWRGDLGVFGEKEERDGVTFFPIYPNPMERIAGLLDSPRSGHIWATAKVGYDFVIPGIEAHAGGGSHGSLHVLDSSPPIIAAGLPDGVELPTYPRLVDLAPLCLDVIGVESDLATGEPYLTGE